MRDSIWTTYDERTKITYREDYKDGKLLLGESTDKDGHKRTYTQLEVKPAPVKGLSDFYSFIGKNMKVPRGVSGRIIVAFVVDKDGVITDIEVKQGISRATDREAVRVIQKYEAWTPGYQRGVPVRVKYTIPITIAKK